MFYSLFHYVEKTNRDLARFLHSIKYSDFSQSFSSEIKGASFSELNNAFNEVIDEFQRARTEKEEHYRYLQTVVQHVGIGLIAYKRDGEIELINNAARRLLKIPRLRNIQQLNKVSPELVHKLMELQPGEKSTVKIQSSEGDSQIFIYSTGFILHEQSFTLVSLQNIQSELEEKEMDAWQNLIRVLTHEIMNSVTPISSLASTASSLLNSKPDDYEDKTELSHDVLDAVKTIEKRSLGLLEFIENYRKLTRIPKPNFKIVQVSELFHRLESLMQEQFKDKSIDCKMEVDPETLELTIDPVMIEQVLINVCKNALEAVSEVDNPVIRISAILDDHGKPMIRIADNGTGIKQEVLDNIFIPFFTTKKDGSGIGLSLSKQIMRMHNGTIKVSSTPRVETIFTLKF